MGRGPRAVGRGPAPTGGSGRALGMDMGRRALGTRPRVGYGGSPPRVAALRVAISRSRPQAGRMPEPPAGAASPEPAARRSRLGRRGPESAPGRQHREPGTAYGGTAGALPNSRPRSAQRKASRGPCALGLPPAAAPAVSWGRPRCKTRMYIQNVWCVRLWPLVFGLAPHRVALRHGHLVLRGSSERLRPSPCAICGPGSATLVGLVRSAGSWTRCSCGLRAADRGLWAVGCWRAAGGGRRAGLRARAGRAAGGDPRSCKLLDNARMRSRAWPAQRATQKGMHIADTAADMGRRGHGGGRSHQGAQAQARRGRRRARRAA